MEFLFFILIFLIFFITAFFIFKPKDFNRNTLELKYDNFEEFLKTFRQQLFINGYKEEKLNSTYIFIKKNKLCLINHIEELTEKHKYKIIKEINDYIKDKNYKDVIIIFATTKSNKVFRDFVDGHIKQELNIFTLPVGICFNSKKVYLYNSCDGNGYFKYILLKRRLKKLLIFNIKIDMKRRDKLIMVAIICWVLASIPFYFIANHISINKYIKDRYEYEKQIIQSSNIIENEIGHIVSFEDSSEKSTLNRKKKVFSSTYIVITENGSRYVIKLVYKGDKHIYEYTINDKILTEDFETVKNRLESSN